MFFPVRWSAGIPYSGTVLETGARQDQRPGDLPACPSLYISSYDTVTAGTFVQVNVYCVPVYRCMSV
jgi:hypothetical protein